MTKSKYTDKRTTAKRMNNRKSFTWMQSAVAVWQCMRVASRTQAHNAKMDLQLLCFCLQSCVVKPHCCIEAKTECKSVTTSPAKL
eukprot:2240833-Amphidinium_carterae.1